MDRPDIDKLERALSAANFSTPVEDNFDLVCADAIYEVMLNQERLDAIVACINAVPWLISRVRELEARGGKRGD